MNWRFSLFLLTMFGLLFVFSWGTSDGGMCQSQFVKDVLAQKNKDGASGCVDFWVNRYQTLITGFFAIGAAAIAFMQLREGRRQTAISRYEFFIERLKAIKKIEAMFNMTQEAVRDSSRVIAAAHHGIAKTDELYRLEECCAEFGDLLDRYHAPPRAAVEYESRLRLYTGFLRDIVSTIGSYGGVTGPHPMLQRHEKWPNTDIGRMQAGILRHAASSALLVERQFIDGIIERAFKNAH